MQILECFVGGFLIGGGIDRTGSVRQRAIRYAVVFAGFVVFAMGAA